ncbi:MAG: zinc-binding dehydrogenase [bacterium]
MKALVKTQKGVGFIELREVEEPRPGQGEVLIEVKAVGICGTDIHVKHDNFPYWPPVILGHEFAGEIVELGPGVTRWKVGDRVVGEPHTQACGQCFLCRTGNVQICPTKRSPGWGINGAMTRFLKFPERLLHAIPDAMSNEEAAVVEPTANAVHDVVERAKLEAGDFVVVLGPGPIGLLAAMTARAGGARHVVVVGRTVDEELRLAKARDLGFETIINVDCENPLEKVLDLTGGVGADLVVECTGALPAIASTVDLVRKKGRICVIGLTGGKPVPFPWDKAAFKVCDIFFNLSTSYTSWDKTIALISTGKIPAGELVTHRLPLEDWETAFDHVENLRALKVLLVP